VPDVLADECEVTAMPNALVFTPTNDIQPFPQSLQVDDGYADARHFLLS
jgi:hypothetical protein